MLLYQIGSSFVILGLFPLLFGRGLYALLGEQDVTNTRSYCFGAAASWALFQLLAVPFILLKASLTALTAAYLTLMLALFLYSVIRCRWLKTLFRRPKTCSRWDRVLLILLLLTVLAMLLLIVRYQHLDDDDARFVVTAVDAIHTDTLLRVNPATGDMIDAWAGELLRDIVSPWSIFQAFLSKITCWHPAILIHTVHPPALFLFLVFILWEMSAHLIGEEIRYRSLFCILFMLILTFAGFNSWSAEGFTLLRIWQGKAVIAAIGIPYLTLVLINTYQGLSRGRFVELLTASVALCLPSNMGILMALMLIFSFGLVYGISKKSWKTALFLWLAMFPAFLYTGISLLL
ncbi:MAG: hypothetical protein IJJ34_05115 [Clostridia bacterium]|nr:hypothetical protein [Clostridia bacterium]